MNEQERSEDRARRSRIRRRRHRLIYLVLLLALAALVLSVTLWLVNHLKNSSGTQIVGDLGVTVAEEGGTLGELAVDSALGTQFSAYQGGVALLTGDEFRIYSSSGKQSFYRQVTMSTPILRTGGKVNLVFDRGGTSYFVVNNQKETLNKTLSLPIINAGVNEKGWCAITAQEKGYKCAVTVLNDKQQEVYYAYFSASYVTAAAVSNDGSYLVTGAVLQEDGLYLTRLSLYDLSEPTPVQQIDLSDVTVLDLRFLENGNLVVLTEESLLIYSRNGDTLELLQQTSFDGENLRAYSLEGGNFACVVLSRFKVGGQGRLVLMDGSGNETQPLTIEEQVVSMSASGTYIAVLTATDVQIYNKKLELVKSESQLTDVRKVLMRSDGTALLVSTNSVRVLH